MILHHVPLIALLFLISYPCPSHLQALVATYSDGNCAEQSYTISGPDGYPNGICTKFSFSTGVSTFQINYLDAGCVVTLYGANTNVQPCSGTATLAKAYTCYEAAPYAYFSVDECSSPPVEVPTVSPTISQMSNPTTMYTPTTIQISTSIASSSYQDTTASQPQSQSQSLLFSSSNPQPTVSQSQTSSDTTSTSISTLSGVSSTTAPTPSSGSESGSSVNVTGAIAGSVVAGTVIIAAIISAYFIWRRRRQKRSLGSTQIPLQDKSPVQIVRRQASTHERERPPGWGPSTTNNQKHMESIYEA